MLISDSFEKHCLHTYPDQTNPPVGVPAHSSLFLLPEADCICNSDLYEFFET